jgi:hypothetical protein
MVQIGKSLPEKYGWNLGHKTGIYAWPYAACSGKLNKNGVYVPLNPEESYNVCIQFCKKNEPFTNEVNAIFNQINTTGEGAITCEQQCQSVYDALGVNTENYTYTPHNNKPYWILPLILLPVFLLFLLYFLK